jgi:hypothetical protein
MLGSLEVREQRVLVSLLSLERTVLVPECSHLKGIVLIRTVPASSFSSFNWGKDGRLLDWNEKVSTFCHAVWPVVFVTYQFS